MSAKHSELERINKKISLSKGRILDLIYLSKIDLERKLVVKDLSEICSGAICDALGEPDMEAGKEPLWIGRVLFTLSIMQEMAHRKHDSLSVTLEQIMEFSDLDKFCSMAWNHPMQKAREYALDIPGLLEKDGRPCISEISFEQFEHVMSAAIRYLKRSCPAL